MTEQFACFRKSRLTVVENAKPVVAGPVIRPYVNRPPICFFRVFEFAQVLVGVRQAPKCGVIGRFDLGGEPEFPYSLLIVSRARGERSQTDVAGRKLVVYLAGSLTCLAALFHPSKGFVVSKFFPVGVTETRKSQGVVGVESYCVLEDLDRAIEILGAIVVLEISSTLKKIIVGFGYLRSATFESLSLAAMDLDFEHSYYAVYYGVLRGKGIHPSDGDALRPQLPPGPRVHQDEIQAHQLSRFMQTAFKNEIRAKLLACIVHGRYLLTAYLR